MASAPPHAAAPSRAARPAVPRAVWAVLVAQGALALAHALSKSLVLDELHSLHHARAPGLGVLLETLRGDNHPPASFVVVGAARALLGESELALRLPLILAGMATTWLVARIAARLEAPALLAAALWAFSSTQIEFSSQVRMYSLSALCLAGALDAALRILDSEGSPGGRRAGLAFAAWTWLGLHTHYYWVLYAGVGASGCLVAAYLVPELRQVLKRVLPYGLAAALLALPWYAWGFRVQLGSDIPPGMSRVGIDVVPEAYVHLLMWNLRLAGPKLRYVFAAMGCLAIVLAAVGCQSLADRGRHAEAWLLASLGLGVPAVAAVGVSLYDRIGLNWSYLLPSGPPFVALVAVAAGARFGGQVLGASVLVHVGALTALNLAAGSTENQREAVRWVLERWRTGDAVVTSTGQPDVFPQGLAWDYYAPRLAHPDEPPAPVAMAEGFDVAAPAQLRRHRRVFLIRRALAEDAPLVQRLRSTFEEAEVLSFGYGLQVHLFEGGVVEAQR